MAGNAIDATGAEALAPALGRLTKLTRLHLGGNAISYLMWQRLLPALAANCHQVL